jgi:hypothetical protein
VDSEFEHAASSAVPATPAALSLRNSLLEVVRRLIKPAPPSLRFTASPDHPKVLIRVYSMDGARETRFLHFEAKGAQRDRSPFFLRSRDWGEIIRFAIDKMGGG